MSHRTTEECLREIEKIGPLNLHQDPDYMLDLLTTKITHLLKTMMEEEGLTISKLAKKLNTSRQYIFKMLHENNRVTLKFLIKIAIALDCEIEINLKKLEP